MEGNRITAVTGWSDVHVGDPADDFAWLIGASDPSFAAAVVAEYSRHTSAEPDPHLLRRAHLEAEFALARWLVRGVSRDLPELVADAESMLRILEKDVEAYDRELSATCGAEAEQSIEARTEHARASRQRAEEDSFTATGLHGLNRDSLFSDPADDAGVGTAEPLADDDSPEPLSLIHI